MPLPGVSSLLPSCLFLPQSHHSPEIVLGGCRHDTYTRLRGVFEAFSPCLSSSHHLHIFLPGHLCPGFLSLSTPGLHHNHHRSLVHQLPPPTCPSAVHHHAALTSAGLAWYYKKAAGSVSQTGEARGRLQLHKIVARGASVLPFFLGLAGGVLGSSGPSVNEGQRGWSQWTVVLGCCWTSRLGGRFHGLPGFLRVLWD